MRKAMSSAERSTARNAGAGTPYRTVPSWRQTATVPKHVPETVSKLSHLIVCRAG